ncbi:alpha/beta hydrolase [Acidisoma sp.]|uniref:alpha/beta hydrolase n=1 Tax=Acidisoma sp. TaxID=1872115 RepID=UPI003B005DE3
MAVFRRDAIPLVASLLASPMMMTRAEAAPEDIPLWPASPPDGGTGPTATEHAGRQGQVMDVRTPRLILHRAAQPNGTAVIVAGGGGYHTIDRRSESGPTARWLAGQGVTAFELIYRLPDDGWPRDAPFADGKRAFRVARAEAGRLGFSGDRLGFLGFSAGGHLAGMTAVGAAPGTYAPVDAADALSPLPSFAALIYPVLTMMPPWNGTQSFRRLLGKGASSAACAAYSVERQVTSGCPPVFLAQASDDPVSPVENSILMFQALRRVSARPEMHIFRQGGHGWGLGAVGSEVAAWPALYATWMTTLSGAT